MSDDILYRLGSDTGTHTHPSHDNLFGPRRRIQNVRNRRHPRELRVDDPDLDSLWVDMPVESTLVVDEELPNDTSSEKKRSSTLEKVVDELRKSVREYKEDHVVEDINTLHYVWEAEDFKPSKDWDFGHALSSSFCPVAFMGYLFLRLPMTWYRRPDKSVGYKFKLISKMSFLCGLNMIFLVGAVGSIIGNFIMISYDFPKRKYWNGESGVDVRREEILVLKRYCAPLLIFSTNAFCLAITSIITFKKREYLCRYFTYWTQVVELIRVNATSEVKGSILLHIFIVFVLTIGHFSMYCSSAFSYMEGGATAISIMLFRGYSNSIIREGNFQYYKWTSAVLASYCYGAQKFYMIWMLYRCRLLKNLFDVWNKRFQRTLLGDPLEKITGERHSKVHLYQDHIATLNIIDGANFEFSAFLELSFICTYFCVTWNFYHAIRSVSGVEFDQPRRLDFFPAILFMVYDLFLFFRVCHEASQIPELVRKSFDIVRKKGMLSTRADPELWFILSLKISFVGTLDGPESGVTAGDYVFLTKPFLIAAFSQLLSFCIMLFQFDFVLDQTLRSDLYCDRIDGAEILQLIEPLGTDKVFPEFNGPRITLCDQEP